MRYRNLKNDEIAVLQQNGCLAENWDHILVNGDFVPDRVRNVYFSGRNRLGVFNASMTLEEGETVQCGVYDCTLNDTVLDDNVFVASVRYLSRYHVQTGAVIRNVGTISVTGKTRFGNGVPVAVLNEAGGREVPVYDQLTAQIAAIMATCRHDKAIVKQLSGMIEEYVSQKESDCGLIGTGAEIRDSGVLQNICVGEYAHINNAHRLEEGTLVSNREAPVRIGAGVIARHFIVQSGSTIDSGAFLDRCFVGQGVQIGKQFSAENSAFFANSEAFHGEAVSLFAGPYTVTHHKSTLLIACMCSFINVGSGTNQSNHMYKLGPLHQGILERGVKTGSFSYMAWPMRVGPYTAVIGKHSDQCDVSQFPFSYINEVEGKSVLTPAMNLLTVGTRRDSEKWKNRDRRKDKVRYDLIHFDLFSPYIMEKILGAMQVMEQLREGASREQEYVFYKGMHIKRLLLKTCSRYYEMAVRIFMGDQLMRRLSQVKQPAETEKILAQLAQTPVVSDSSWVDVAGLTMPAGVLEDLLDRIASASFVTLADLEKALKRIYDRYDEYAWMYAASLIEQRTGTKRAQWNADLLTGIIDDWQVNSVKLNKMIQQDARKEFDPSSKIGYGVYGHIEEDFVAVRGTFEENSFVTGIDKLIAAFPSQAQQAKKQAGLP